MAFIHPQGALSWKPSNAPDLASYRLYQGTEAEPPNYTSPFVDVGNVTQVQLPIEGLPGVEGRVVFAVGAVDSAGNISDLTPISEAVLIDVTPPDAPTEVTYSRDF